MQYTHRLSDHGSCEGGGCRFVLLEFEDRGKVPENKITEISDFAVFPLIMITEGFDWLGPNHTLYTA